MNPLAGRQEAGPKCPTSEEGSCPKRGSFGTTEQACRKAERAKTLLLACCYQEVARQAPLYLRKPNSAANFQPAGYVKNIYVYAHPHAGSHVWRKGVRKDAGVFAVVVISIALGIAANSTVYSIVNSILYSSIPVHDPGSLFTLNDGNSFSWPNFMDYRDQTTGKVFEGMAGFFPLVSANIGGSGQPERVWGQLVTGNYFKVAGVEPALGRTFLPEEDQAEGRNPVVILGHALWQRRFGSDHSVIGRPVLLNGRQYIVVGVAPAGFTGTVKMLTGEFWVPVAMYAHLMPDLAKDDLKNTRDGQWITLDARLKPGVTKEQATAALNVVKNRIDETHHKGDKERQKQRIFLTRAGRMPELGNMMGLMAVLMVVVGLVLLIACANVANLMVARAAARRRRDRHPPFDRLQP